MPWCRLSVLSNFWLSPSFGDESLSTLLEKTAIEYGVPAMGAIAFRSNALLARGVTGVRTRGQNEKVTLEDKWHLGSLTKSMTATLAAIAVEQKKLSWDTSIQDSLGNDFKIATAYQSVTLGGLLRHRGGFPSTTTSADWWKLMRAQGDERTQRKRVLKAVFQMEPETPPMSRAKYANLNFVVAGGMLEQATDTPWQDLIRKQLFDPLGMASAGFGPPALGAETKQPWGHDAQGIAIPPTGDAADNPPVLGPAGTVHCSLNDLAKYYSFHLRKGTSQKGQRLIAADAFDTLHGLDQDEDQWGYGWVKAERPWAGGIALHHAGTNTMFYAVVWLAPARDFGVAVVTNQGGDNAAKATDVVAGSLVPGRKCLRAYDS